MSEHFNTPCIWDKAAATFDDAPDHGLIDPPIRQAWSEILSKYLPQHASNILDIGCGTGSLSLLMVHLGHHVTGIDISPKMIIQAKKKSDKANANISFSVMDAAHLDSNLPSFDVVVCRHVLWVFGNYPKVLRSWIEMLKPGGQLILIEGYWHTGGGLHAIDVFSEIKSHKGTALYESLSENMALWGNQVTDERYLISFIKA